MITVTVKARPCTNMEDLHPLDRDMFLTITRPFRISLMDSYADDPEEYALNLYHSTVPIKELGDWDITTEITKVPIQPKKQFAIFRHPNGISLNGKQYVLDDEDEVMLFDSEEDASDYYVIMGGGTYDDIGQAIFIEEYEEEEEVGPNFDPVPQSPDGKKYYMTGEQLAAISTLAYDLGMPREELLTRYFDYHNLMIGEDRPGIYGLTHAQAQGVMLYAVNLKAETDIELMENHKKEKSRGRER